MRPSGKTDDWFTPIELFETHQQRTGWRYCIDPCGHNEAPVSNAIGNWLTDGGIESPWLCGRGSGYRMKDGHAAWINPPYSDIAPWVDCAVNAAEKFVNITLLLPQWCDRLWWHKHIEPIRDRKPRRGQALTARATFLPGRVKFGFPGDETGRKGVSPTFGVVLVDIWRPQ